MMNIDFLLALMRTALLLLSPFVSAWLVFYCANQFFGRYARFTKYTIYFWLGFWIAVIVCYVGLMSIREQSKVFDGLFLTIASAGGIGILCWRNVQQVSIVRKIVLSLFLLLCFSGLLWLFYVATEWLWVYLHAYLVTVPQLKQMMH